MDGRRPPAASTESPDLERGYSLQPLADSMGRHNLKPHDLVAAPNAQRDGLAAAPLGWEL